MKPIAPDYIPVLARSNEIAIQDPWIDSAILRLALYPSCNRALDRALVAMTDASNGWAMAEMQNKILRAQVSNWNRQWKIEHDIGAASARSARAEGIAFGAASVALAVAGAWIGYSISSNIQGAAVGGISGGLAGAGIVIVWSARRDGRIRAGLKMM